MSLGGFRNARPRSQMAKLIRSLSDISISDLRRRIKSLREADLKSLSFDATAHRIHAIIDQYMFQIRPLQLNAVYRARRNKPGEIFSSAKELWYPPASAITRPSRLNEAGEVRFYGANMPNTSLLELQPVDGDVFTILVAGTHSGKIETLNVAFIGLERALAPEVQHLTEADMFRHAPHFRSTLRPANYKKWLLIDDYLSEIFGTPVSEGEDHKYKPTIALSKLLFTAPGLDAVNYPSVATDDHGINICMIPDKADQLFAPIEAWQVKVGEGALHPSTGEFLQRIKFLSRSRDIGSDGTIEWFAPGEGINPAEIMRFARRRVLNLPEWPLSARK
jgi:RES domain